mmetsp:Transcript_24987/g.65515  ORF Transcript_24987/g.65515 Transcript_24987/m.65515 type:complete len:95 (+) Transcript_24987:116-400(+)
MEKTLLGFLVKFRPLPKPEPVADLLWPASIKLTLKTAINFITRVYRETERWLCEMNIGLNIGTKPSPNHRISSPKTRKAHPEARNTLWMFQNGE